MQIYTNIQIQEFVNKLSVYCKLKTDEGRCGHPTGKRACTKQPVRLPVMGGAEYSKLVYGCSFFQLRCFLQRLFVNGDTVLLDCEHKSGFIGNIFYQHNEEGMFCLNGSFLQ